MKKFVLMALLAPTIAFAGPTLNLAADARAQVANDEMVVTFTVEREGVDSAPLTDAVLIALNDAVKEAKATPGVNTRMGNVSTNPDWKDNKKIGWTVRGELTMASKDMKTLAALTGRLSQTLQVAGVSFRLSDGRRAEEEGRLLKVAAANFKAKATEATAAFGYGAYEVKELTVGQSSGPGMVRPMMMAMKAQRASIPVESGDSEVTVNVNGQVSLLKTY